MSRANYGEWDFRGKAAGRAPAVVDGRAFAFQAFVFSRVLPSRITARITGSFPQGVPGEVALALGHCRGPLGCDVDLLTGAGHVSIPDGYGPWPSALEWCLDPAARLKVN